MAPSRFMLPAGTILIISLFLVSAEQGCLRNEIKARAPNIFKVVYPASPGFFISNVSLGQRHSFYMCQSGDNFGYNISHWWVSKGCDATFILTECPSSVNN